jgi:hypothetical protein
MKTVLTTNCGQFNHPEFELAYDPDTVLDRDVLWLAGILEQQVANGERFSDNQSFQLGWMFTLIHQNDNGTLSILEPEMTEMPIRWQNSVTNTLRHLRLQKDTGESLLPAEALVFPSYRQSCIVCDRLGHSREIVMDRREPGDQESGWFIGCVADEYDHNNPDNLRVVSLYEAVVCLEPRVLRYLALPPGVLLHVGGEQAVFFLDESRLEIRPGSYLEKVLRKNPGD